MRSLLAAVVLAGTFAFAVPTVTFAAGAIAVDDEVDLEAGDTGYGIGFGNTAAEAAAQAMKECRSAGNESCKVVSRFNGCGAVAVSRKFYGAGSGTTEAAAERAALNACGNRNCKVVVSDCE